MNAMDEREIIGLTTSEDFNGTQRPIPEDRSDRDKTKTNTQRIRLDRKASYLLLYRRSLSSPFGQDFFYKKKKRNLSSEFSFFQIVLSIHLMRVIDICKGWNNS